MTFAARDGAPIMNGCNVESAFETPPMPSSRPQHPDLRPLSLIRQQIIANEPDQLADAYRPEPALRNDGGRLQESAFALRSTTGLFEEVPQFNDLVLVGNSLMVMGPKRALHSVKRNL